MEPEVIDANFQMVNTGTPEVEVLEFLYGLVRIVKPKAILETGTYKGWSAAVMAQAMKDNGMGGGVITLETNLWIIKEAQELHRLFNLDNVERRHVSSLVYRPDTTFDLVFLDTEPDIRFRELLRFFPFVRQGGFIIVHDLPPTLCQGNVNPDHPEIKSWPFGDLPEEIKQWVKEGELRVTHFPNSRGMVGFYKAKEADYRWN